MEIVTYVYTQYVIDTLNDDPQNIENMTYDKTAFLSLLEQRFAFGQHEVDMLKDDKNWKQFVPHENSGPCYTYNPPFDSDPGTGMSMYMTFNMNNWDPSLQIFLHEPNGFFYSTKPVRNTMLLNLAGTKHPRATGKSLSFV